MPVRPRDALRRNDDERLICWPLGSLSRLGFLQAAAFCAKFTPLSQKSICQFGFPVTENKKYFEAVVLERHSGLRRRQSGKKQKNIREMTSMILWIFDSSIWFTQVTIQH